MLRVLLACMVPCLAIGFTGLLVTTIGRTLLAISGDAATVTALIFTLLIMGGCTLAARAVARRGATEAAEPPRH
jgi:hypothetical protein